MSDTAMTRIAGGASMRGIRLAFVLLLSACSLGSDDEPKPCELLREHVLDVSLADVALEQRDAHRAALQQALGDFVETCSTKLSEIQISCALATKSSSALRYCTTTP
ncbi:MAG: hypothetical protein KF773_27295 [Deltaproteobacteria bacterium]|nr:hypothetical protein [Deltaproteobacteria bacterium]